MLRGYMRAAIRHVPTLLVSLACLSCADIEPRELTSPCCDCLIKNQCTKWNEEHCKQWANGLRKDTQEIDSECAVRHGCTNLCADEGMVWVK